MFYINVNYPIGDQIDMAIWGYGIEEWPIYESDVSLFLSYFTSN